jgi:hypothetical protein
MVACRWMPRSVAIKGSSRRGPHQAPARLWVWELRVGWSGVGRVGQAFQLDELSPAAGAIQAQSNGFDPAGEADDHGGVHQAGSWLLDQDDQRLCGGCGRVGGSGLGEGVPDGPEAVAGKPLQRPSRIGRVVRPIPRRRRRGRGRVRARRRPLRLVRAESRARCCDPWGPRSSAFGSTASGRASAIDPSRSPGRLRTPERSAGRDRRRRACGSASPWPFRSRLGDRRRDGWSMDPPSGTLATNCPPDSVGAAPQTRLFRVEGVLQRPGFRARRLVQCTPQVNQGPPPPPSPSATRCTPPAGPMAGPPGRTLVATRGSGAILAEWLGRCLQASPGSYAASPTARRLRRTESQGSRPAARTCQRLPAGAPSPPQPSSQRQRGRGG